MPAVPFFIGDPILKLIQPLLGGFIDHGLINEGQEDLPGLIFQRAGMRQYDVYAVLPSGKLFLNKGFRLIRGLLIGPPSRTAFQPIVFVHAVSAADDNALAAIQPEYFAVPGKKNIGVLLFYIYLATIPVFQLVGGYRMRPCSWLP